MSRATVFFFGSLVFLFNCSTACGQASCFTPHFSIYTSVSRDGTNIYTAVSTTGYTSISPICSMSSATHKVGAQNVISNTGGWTYSASSCPSCYYSITGYNSGFPRDQIIHGRGVGYRSAVSLAHFFMVAAPAVFQVA